MSAIKYLKGKEWSMGNGQCPDCCGVPASWHGHPNYMTPETIGHKEDCTLADSLSELGESPLFIGEFKSDKEYEDFISEARQQSRFFWRDGDTASAVNNYIRAGFDVN